MELVDTRLASHDARVGAGETSISVINTRLDNGTKAFAEIAARVTRVEPKHPSVLKISSIVLSVALAAAGGLWGLSNTLRDRPTVEQMKQVLLEHDTNGHPKLRESMAEFRSQQLVNVEIVRAMGVTQAGQTKKLDEILARVPARRK